MARRTIHMLVDDLDGGEADETVTFALDGIQYEIDLSEKNAGKLRKALEVFVTAGSKVGRGGVTRSRAAAAPARGSAPQKGDRDQNRAVREWAQENGIPVSDRGRIKQEILDRYRAEAGR